MKKTITMKEIMEVNTWSVKDDSPRGCKTVSCYDVKPGDKVVYDNRFTLVIDDEPEAETEAETTENGAKMSEDTKEKKGCFKMKNECMEYAERIRDEIYSYYDGKETGDDGEALSLYDYFDDVLDYEWLIDSQLEYKSVKLFVTLGGPTAWIDTETGWVEVRWGTEEGFAYLSMEVRDEIDAIFEDYYNC